MDCPSQVVLAVRAAFVLLLVGFARSILGVRKHSTAVTSCVLTASMASFEQGSADANLHSSSLQ